MTLDERLKDLGETPESIAWLKAHPEQLVKLREELCDCLAELLDEDHLGDCPARGLK